MTMRMPAALRTTIQLFLFTLILHLGSAHTTVAAAAAAEVVGDDSTVVNNSSHHHSSLLSLANDYHHHRPASSTTVPPGVSHDNDDAVSSSSSIYDYDEQDEYVYSICINCHVIFDIRIVITDATSHNSSDDDDDGLYSSSTSNNKGPHPNHDATDNFTPRAGSSLRMPMPSIQWHVLLHEIHPADANGSNGATLLSLANAIAHPSSSVDQQQQQAQPQHHQNHTLAARIVVPYSSFVKRGDSRANKRMMREVVVVASLIREDDDSPNNNNNNNKKNNRIIVNRTLINVAIPNNDYEIVNKHNDKGSSNIHHQRRSRTMSSYYNSIDPIYTTILEDSVPFINVDTDPMMMHNNSNNDEDNNNEEDVTTKVVMEKMENWSSSISESTTTTTASSFDKHPQYHTTIMQACFVGILGGSIVLLLFGMIISSSSFNNDNEVNENENNSNNNNYCQNDGTPEPYSHNSDGEYIGPRYSVVVENNDGRMIVDSLFHTAGNNVDDDETSSSLLHNNNDVLNDSSSPSSSSSRDDDDGHLTAIKVHLHYSPLDCQSPGSSIAALPNSNSPSMLDEMTDYEEGDHTQRGVANELLHLAHSTTKSMLPQANKSYDDNHNILLDVFGPSKLDTESTTVSNDGGSIPEEYNKVPSRNNRTDSFDLPAVEDDVNKNVNVAERSNTPVKVDETESRQQFQLSFDYHNVERTTSAGVDSEIDVTSMSSETKLHTNYDDDAEAHVDYEYEANEGKINLTSPPKIGRITTNSPHVLAFDPIVTTSYSPAAEVARCITRSCNERETIMEYGHELQQQTSSKSEPGVEDERDIDMSEADILNDDEKQSSSKDSSNPSVSSSAITVRAHNSNCGVKRSATEFQCSEDGTTTSSHLSTSITSVQTSDKRQRRKPTTIPARVSTSPTFAPALPESDVGNKENHSSSKYILDSNDVLFGSNDNVSSAGCDSPSLPLKPLTKELSVDDKADRFPSPSSTVAATVHEFADPWRNKAYDHPIPIPSGGAGQSKRFGISSTRTSSSISYPDQRFEHEPSDSLVSNQVDDYVRRKRTKQKTRKIESKLRAAMKRVIKDKKPSSTLTDLSLRVEESAWQFSSDEIQINRRDFANDTTSEKSY